MPCERNFWEQKAVGVDMSLVWAYWQSGNHCSWIICVPQNKALCGNKLEMWANDVYSDQVLSKWK